MANYTKKMKHLNVLWVFLNVLFTHLLNSRAPGMTQPWLLQRLLPFRAAEMRAFRLGQDKPRPG